MVVTVNPEYTSQNDCKGLNQGKRQGKIYYGIDNVQLDADINASVNIANRHLFNNQILNSKYLVSYANKITYCRQASVNKPIIDDSNINLQATLLYGGVVVD